MFASICVAFLVSQASAVTKDAPKQDEHVFKIGSRDLEFPINVDPARMNDMKEIQLFASWDKGKSWECIAKAKPNVPAIHVRVKRDGLAWFAIRTLDVKGIADPADLRKSDVCKLLIRSQEARPR